MDESFLAALFPRRHRILGRRLRPYCYGHLVALAAAGSPFLAPVGAGATISVGDLLAALRICAAPGYPFLAPDRFGPGLADVARRWWLEQRPARLCSAAQAFRDYQDDYSQFPEFWAEESVGDDGEEEEGDLLAQADTGRQLSAPVALARVAALISRTSITLAQAWQMPIGMPSWYCGCLDEMDGAKVRFVREDEVDGSDMPAEPELTERQLHAQAIRHLGRNRASEWWQARKAAQRRERNNKRKGS